MLNQIASPTVCYEIDDEDVICSLNPAWLNFAAANGVSGLDPEHVLGQQLWDYIKGEDTADLYRLLLNHVRASRKAVSFPYRCDSPELRRFMRMSIHPISKDRVEFPNICRGCEPRKKALHIAHVAMGAHPLLIRCSMCSQMRIQGKWLDIDRAVAQGEIMNSDLTFTVAYGICDSCRMTIPGLYSGEDLVEK